MLHSLTLLHVQSHVTLPCKHRCFPACSVRGHTKGGFCGRPLQVLFEIKDSRDKKMVEERISKFVYVAEIRAEGAPGLSSNLIIDKSKMNSMVRSNGRYSGTGSPSGELVLGKIMHSTVTPDCTTISVQFNSELHSWDYSWKSNRWEVNKTHVIDVIVLEDCGNNSLHVLNSYPSPSFTIFSARHIKTSVNKELKASTLVEKQLLPNLSKYPLESPDHKVSTLSSPEPDYHSQDSVNTKKKVSKNSVGKVVENYKFNPQRTCDKNKLQNYSGIPLQMMFPMYTNTVSPHLLKFYPPVFDSNNSIDISSLSTNFVNEDNQSVMSTSHDLFMKNNGNRNKRYRSNSSDSNSSLSSKKRSYSTSDSDAIFSSSGSDTSSSPTDNIHHVQHRRATLADLCDVVEAITNH